MKEEYLTVMDGFLRGMDAVIMRTHKLEEITRNLTAFRALELSFQLPVIEFVSFRPDQALTVLTC